MGDSRSLSDVLTRAICTTKNFLMMDLQTMKDDYRSVEVNYIAFSRSEHNIAGHLQSLMPIMYFRSPNGKWVIRTNFNEFFIVSQ